MLPRQITHQNIFRVLLAGFSLVIVLLLAAALVGIRNIQSIQANAASLVREQSLTNRLIDELHSQQTSSQRSLFGPGARPRFGGLRPDHEPARRGRPRYRPHLRGRRAHRRAAISGSGSTVVASISRGRRAACCPARTSRPSPPWISSAFTGPSTSVVARLLEAEYRKLNAAQAQIEHRTSRLLRQLR